MGLRGTLLVLVLVILGGSADPSQAQLGRRGTVTLNWTAPGDDSLTGQAVMYDIRMSPRPISLETFESCKQIAAFPPSISGTQERFTVPGLVPGVEYFFAIRSRDEAGNWSGLSNVAYRVGRPIETEFGAEFGLAPLWPNPAVHRTHTKLRVPAGIDGKVEVFDATGRRVRTLVSGETGGGTVNFSWNLIADDGIPVHAGVYIMRAQFGDWQQQRRVTVVR